MTLLWYTYMLALLSQKNITTVQSNSLFNGNYSYLLRDVFLPRPLVFLQPDNDNSGAVGEKRLWVPQTLTKKLLLLFIVRIQFKMHK